MAHDKGNRRSIDYVAEERLIRGLSVAVIKFQLHAVDASLDGPIVVS